MPAKNVMRKFAAGRLHSGSKSGPLVKDRAQALAIMLSERRDEESGNHERRERKKPARTKR